MDDEVVTIDSFVAKAIYKITIQLIVRGIHGANLHLRVTLKVDSSVDETISDKKHSMDFFFDSGLIKLFKWGLCQRLLSCHKLSCRIPRHTRLDLKES